MDPETRAQTPNNAPNKTPSITTTARRGRDARNGAVILLWVASTGLAAAEPSNPCNAPASAVKELYADLTMGGSFGCAPFPVGSGTLPTMRSNAAGSVAWWYCPTGAGKWRLNWAAGTADALSGKNLFDDAYRVITAENPRAAFDAITSKNVRLPLSDPKLTPVWCPFVQEMLAGAPKAASGVGGAGGPDGAASSVPRKP